MTEVEKLVEDMNVARMEASLDEKGMKFVGMELRNYLAQAMLRVVLKKIQDVAEVNSTLSDKNGYCVTKVGLKQPFQSFLDEKEK